MQHCLRMPAALASLLTRPVKPACAAPVASAAWHGVSNRLPITPAPAAAYSSGAGSSDAIPPSNLPSGVMSSEASAADDDTFDQMPDSVFPAGAKRTPGPSETVSADAARNDTDVAQDYPHADPARESGSAAADPYGPNDASSTVSRPKEPQPDSLYPPSGQPGAGPEMQQPPAGQPGKGPDDGTPHPPLERIEPGGTHLS